MPSHCNKVGAQSAVPTKQWHLQKKETNFQASKQLELATGKFLDWEITTLFYSALQYVDAYFADFVNPEHPARHSRRRKLVSRFLQPVAVEYRMLNELSEGARYETFTPQQSDAQAALSWYSAIQNFLQKIVKP
jgi:hypothetical protein